MPQQTVIPVAEASQAGEARRAAARVAQAAGLDETRRGVVAIVATELANNLARYGRGGKLFIQTVSAASADGTAVEIVAVDSGPGMDDVGRCMQDGFSTGGTPGTGLGAVRRLAAEFDVYSARGSGTAVVARVGGRPRAASPAAARPAFQWAAVSIPAPNETVCGDAWRVIERGDEIRVMVADGLGHGPLAADASGAAARLFEKDAAAAPSAAAAGPHAFIERAHRQICGTRGAAVAAAAGSATSRLLRYAGVGNISGSLLSGGESRGLFSHNGTVGHQMRKAQQFDYPWPDRGLLVMHSDGLQSRWRLDDYPGLVTRHPAVIAAVLYRDFVRGRDDVTVVVARLGPC